MSATPAAAAQMTIREVLKLKPVRRLWTAQVVSVFGDFLAIFAVLSYVSFNLHATAVQVTLISISFMIPFAVIGPVAGVFVDRWNVKRTMIASDLIRAVLALALVFAGNLAEIYGILFLLSAVSTFFVPAQSVTVRTIVPREGLLSANALIQQAFQVMRIISPALAGAFVAWFGASFCYYIDSVTFLFSASMIATLVIAREPAVPDKDSHPLKSVLNDLLEGVKFIFTHPTISFVIIAMAAGMFAVSCFGPLIAVYVRDELQANSLAFGIINSLIGVGMILGTVVISRFGKEVSKTHLALGGLFTMGAFVVVMAAFKTIAAASAGMLGLGIGVLFVIVAAQTLMQGQTPAQLVGRVSSSFMAVLSVSQLVGLVISGSLAQTLGIRNLFFASAAMLLLITVLGFFRLPQQSPSAMPTPQEQPVE
ncbi:MAG TPA: MFS transporter [Blastocatellia bacterium]|jgi:DHA3 family macrolide efflux protein-like MFS transporter